MLTLNYYQLLSNRKGGTSRRFITRLCLFWNVDFSLDFHASDGDETGSGVGRIVSIGRVGTDDRGIIRWIPA